MPTLPHAAINATTDTGAIDNECLSWIMQLAQIQGFLEVTRRGNVCRAADTLNITQPALTARLQASSRSSASRSSSARGAASS